MPKGFSRDPERLKTLILVSLRRYKYGHTRDCIASHFGSTYGKMIPNATFHDCPEPEKHYRNDVVDRLLKELMADDLVGYANGRYFAKDSDEWIHLRTVHRNKGRRKKS